MMKLYAIVPILLLVIVGLGCDDVHNLIGIDIVPAGQGKVGDLIWNITSTGAHGYAYNYESDYSTLLAYSYCLPESSYTINFRQAEAPFYYEITVDGAVLKTGYINVTSAIVNFETSHVAFVFENTGGVSFKLSKHYNVVEFVELGTSDVGFSIRLPNGIYALDTLEAGPFAIYANDNLLYASEGTTVNGESVYFKIASGIATLTEASNFADSNDGDDSSIFPTYYPGMSFNTVAGIVIFCLLICVGIAYTVYVCRKVYNRRRTEEMMTTSQI
jgi:archaellum component FlaF (FlaF/FlaG flagellin family)